MPGAIKKKARPEFSRSMQKLNTYKKEESFKMESAIAEIPPETFKGIPAKKVEFILDYLKHYNQQLAARNIGYSHAEAPRAARNILKDPKVKKAKDAAHAFIMKKLEYGLEKSIKFQLELLNEARANNQYMAVNALKAHLDALTRVYDPTRFKFEVDVKNTFTLNFGGIKLPEYAKDVIETKANEIVGGEIQKALNPGKGEDEPTS